MENEKKERIKERVDLIDLASEYTDLMPAGKGEEYRGRCPLPSHEDKNPSFSINRNRGFICHGCGWDGGDCIELVRKLEGISFKQALQKLAQRVGMEAPAEKEPSRKQKIRRAVQKAADHYKEMMGEAQKAKAYLRRRGIKSEVVESMGVGYATEDAFRTLDYLRDEGVDLEVIRGTGLIQGKEGKEHDRFTGRIMFPIRSEVGDVVGFAGRILPGDEDHRKYINTPETSLYRKRETLFGVKKGKSAIQSQDVAIVVEGYTDVLQMRQAGIENVVATCGTGLTETQFEMLERKASVVKLLYDGDASGQDAADSDVLEAIETGIDIEVVTLPEGVDPDAFLRTHGAHKLRKKLADEGEGVVERMYSAGKREAKMNRPESRANLHRTVAAKIAKAKDRTAQIEYVKQAVKVGGASGIEMMKMLAEKNGNEFSQKEAEMIFDRWDREWATDGREPRPDSRERVSGSPELRSDDARSDDADARCDRDRRDVDPEEEVEAESQPAGQAQEITRSEEQPKVEGEGGESRSGPSAETPIESTGAGLPQDRSGGKTSPDSLGVAQREKAAGKETDESDEDGPSGLEMFGGADVGSGDSGSGGSNGEDTADDRADHDDQLPEEQAEEAKGAAGEDEADRIRETRTQQDYSQQDQGPQEKGPQDRGCGDRTGEDQMRADKIEGDKAKGVDLSGLFPKAETVTEKEKQKLREERHRRGDQVPVIKDHEAGFDGRGVDEDRRGGSTSEQSGRPGRKKEENLTGAEKLLVSRMLERGREAVEMVGRETEDLDLTEPFGTILRDLRSAERGVGIGRIRVKRVETSHKAKLMGIADVPEWDLVEEAGISGNRKDGRWALERQCIAALKEKETADHQKQAEGEEDQGRTESGKSSDVLRALKEGDTDSILERI